MDSGTLRFIAFLIVMFAIVSGMIGSGKAARIGKCSCNKCGYIGLLNSKLACPRCNGTDWMKI
jgi:hypothetical protein